MYVMPRLAPRWCGGLGKLDEAGNPSQRDPIGSSKTGGIDIDASGWLGTGQEQESRLERTQINPCDTNRIRGDLISPFKYNDTRSKDRIYEHNEPRATGRAGNKHRLGTTFPPRLEPETEWYYACTNHYCVAPT
jgi:hypothetical protein